MCRQGHTFVRVHDVFARCACQSEVHVHALVSSLLCFCSTVHVTVITHLACTPSSMSALHGLAEKICTSTAGWGRSPECRVLLMSGELGGFHEYCETDTPTLSRLEWLQSRVSSPSHTCHTSRSACSSRPAALFAAAHVPHVYLRGRQHTSPLCHRTRAARLSPKAATDQLPSSPSHACLASHSASVRIPATPSGHQTHASRLSPQAAADQLTSSPSHTCLTTDNGRSDVGIATQLPTRCTTD